MELLLVFILFQIIFVHGNSETPRGKILHFGEKTKCGGVQFPVSRQQGPKDFECRLEKPSFQKQGHVITCDCNKDHNIFDPLEFKRNKPIFCEIQKVKAKKKISHLNFKFCRFRTIERQVFEALKLSDLKEITFNKCSFEDIERSAFSFPTSNISMLIDNVTKPLKMDQEYFYGSAVSHLIINDAYLEQFTTDSFLNVHQDAIIQIMNSQIEGRSSKKGVIPLKIKSIDFINNKMLEIYRDTIFVEASEHVKFDGCDLKY